MLQNPGHGPVGAPPGLRPRVRRSARERAERAGLAMALGLTLLWSVALGVDRAAPDLLPRPRLRLAEPDSHHRGAPVACPGAGWLALGGTYSVASQAASADGSGTANE